MRSLRAIWFPVLVFTTMVAWTTLVAPREASAGELHIETDAATVYPISPSFTIVSDTTTISDGRLGLGYAFGDDVVPGLRAYLVYSGGAQSATRFDNDLNFEWSRNLYLAGVGWGYEIQEFFRPFLRTLFGYAHQQLSLETPSGDFSQPGHDFAVLSSGGFEIYFPYQREGESNAGFSRRLTFGFDAELGYLWQTPAVYDNLQRTSDDWQRSGADIGVLNANGFFWSAGIFARIRL